MIPEDLIDAAEHTGHVVVDENHAGVVGLVHGEAAQRDLGHVDRAGGDALVHVAYECLGDFDADRGLSFLRRAADVWCQDQVLQRAQVLRPGPKVVREVVAVAGGFGRVDVECGAGDFARPGRVDERRDVDDGAAAGVNQVGAVLHGGELVGADHVHGLGQLGDVAGHEVGALQQVGEGRHLARGAHGHQVDDVVVDDVHAHRLGQHRQLRPDVPVADDPQRLAPDLPALGRYLVPRTQVHFIAAICHLPCQCDDLADDEFRDGAGVRER